MTFSVSCAIFPGNSRTGQISYLREADFTWIQTCSTYMSGRYPTIPAEETLFCQGFNSHCLCKEEVPLSSL
ncbi:hypothetical protein DPMN_026105 [Dreissena polymorpha]|uniref:Uncharacterized protein n=1 Tax=Dreissena polymorpha TaxID=45954 RepID=A0A9D4LST4_DREPO|nr:hypothetical protein DPMN_026105 [Dreissena polymorpha]